MHCTKCGCANPEGATQCEQCGAPLIAGAAEERKTIQLPSHHDEAVPEPIERPWEVRVPKRVKRTGTTGKMPRARQSAEKPVAASPEQPAHTGKAVTGASIGGAAAETIAFTPIGIDAAAKTAQAVAAGAAAGPVVAAAGAADATPADAAAGAAESAAADAVGATGAIDGAAAHEATAATNTTTAPEGSVAQSTAATPRPAPTPRRATRDIKERTAATRSANTRSINGGVGTRYATSDGGSWKRNVLIIALIACLIAGLAFFLTQGSGKNTVSFVSNGGSSVSEQTIVNGGELKQPTPPTRNGYTFDGWFYDADFTSPVEFPVTVTQNMSLYAKWSPESSTSGSVSASTSSSASASAQSAANDTGGVPSSITYSSSDTNSGSGYSGSGSGSGYSGSGSGDSGSGSGSDEGNSSSGDSGGESATSTSSVSVLTKGGDVLSGTVHLTDGFVIPDSSTHAYSLDELRALGLNEAELCIARNEPYARVGYDFLNSGLQAYFDDSGWYANLGADDSALPVGSAGYITAINLKKLAEEDPNGAGRWLDLAES